MFTGLFWDIFRRKWKISLRGLLPDFNKIIRFVAGMKEEPDFLDEMIDAGFSSGPSHIHHPFMSGLVILFSFIRRNISG